MCDYRRLGGIFVERREAGAWPDSALGRGDNGGMTDGRAPVLFPASCIISERWHATVNKSQNDSFTEPNSPELRPTRKGTDAVSLEILRPAETNGRRGG